MSWIQPCGGDVPIPVSTEEEHDEQSNTQRINNFSEKLQLTPEEKTTLLQYPYLIDEIEASLSDYPVVSGRKKSKQFMAFYKKFKEI